MSQQPLFSENFELIHENVLIYLHTILYSKSMYIVKLGISMHIEELIINNLSSLGIISQPRSACKKSSYFDSKLLQCCQPKIICRSKFSPSYKWRPIYIYIIPLPSLVIIKTYCIRSMLEEKYVRSLYMGLPLLAVFAESWSRFQQLDRLTTVNMLEIHHYI